MKKTILISFLALALLTIICLCSAHPGLSQDYSNLPDLHYTDRADSAHGFDVSKYDINLNVDYQTHYISGVVKAWVTAEETLTGIDYNLVGLAVSQVRVDNTITTFTQQNGILHINLNAASGQEFLTEVTYAGTPQLSPAPYNIGIIFSTNTVFTISDPDAARYWWPCFDHPWDKALVDLHIRLRSDWLVACNGLRDSIIDNGDGTKTHNWLGSNPMTTYLVCFTAGPYQEINQTTGNVPIQNFVLASQYNNALVDFSNLPSILQFYATQFGPYPFEKYGNAVVSMSTYGAMEHQTMTTLGNYLITGNHSGELTIAHELAHSWYGNCLTPLTFKDVWLSEGFATYAEFLWSHHQDGWQTACDFMENNFHQYYINWESANSGLQNIIYDPPFNYYFYPQSYEKAASVLHMLRLKIGNTAFFQLLQNWFTTFHNGNVVTAEFQAMAEQLSGLDLDQFFQQWIYSRGIPAVEYTAMIGPGHTQGKIIGKTSCTTGTEFTLEIPFVASGLANGDSLVFVADPSGFSRTFSLAQGYSSYSVEDIDPQHWILCRQISEKDVVLTQCLASNHSIYLTWDAFSLIPELAGYHVFRAAAGEDYFTQLTQTPLNQTDFLDTSAQNGIQYYYCIKAMDTAGFITTGSNVLSATPVDFAFDWGLLVVDETRDGTGAAISPNDSMVDVFYAAALSPLPYATWDYASLGAPSLSTLSHYPIVLWHADDYSQNLLGNNLASLGGYLYGNGKLIISGWKTPSVLTQSFLDTFMPNTDLIYDNGAALISVQSETYPQLQVDPEKLTPTWNNMLPMVYTFEAEEEILYTANMAAGAAGNGLAIGIRFDTPGTLIWFGFPLYFMQAAGVRDLLQQLLPELWPALPAIDENQVSPALQISVYPNPARTFLNISCSQKLLPQSTFRIYDVKGRRIATVEIGKSATDSGSLRWIAQSDKGDALAPGIYLLRYEDERQSRIVKFLLF
jgi:hypothetical protein